MIILRNLYFLHCQIIISRGARARQQDYFILGILLGVEEQMVVYGSIISVIDSYVSWAVSVRIDI